MESNNHRIDDYFITDQDFEIVSPNQQDYFWQDEESCGGNSNQGEYADTLRDSCSEVMNSSLFDLRHIDHDLFVPPDDFYSGNVLKKKHQAQAIQWMIDRESGAMGGLSKGGFLFDDMGLGKTLELLSLVQFSLITRPSEKTLIVCPTSVMQSWKSHIETMFSPTVENPIKCIMYHGGKRRMLKLAESNVFITTYGIVSNAFESESKMFSEPLFNELFTRVILDEAHAIRNDSKMSRAALQLMCMQPWCATGTPIMNNINDLRRLIEFNGYSKYIDRENWNRLIVSPIKQNATRGAQKIFEMLEPITIRRTIDVIDIPKIDTQTILIDLKPDERSFYQLLFQYSSDRVFELMKRMKDIKEHGVSEDDSLRQINANILVIIMRLRQAAVCPAIVIKSMKRLRGFNTASTLSPDDMAKAIERLREAVENRETECVICMDSEATHYSNNCGHMCCADCWTKMQQSRCPFCRAPVFPRNLLLIERVAPKSNCNTVDDPMNIDPVEALEDILKFVPSKFDWLINHLESHDKKVIIASQWVSVIEELQKVIKARMPNESCLVLQGSMTLNQRNETIKQFQSDTSPARICIISMLASGQGITLTNAKYVYLMDHWWNSSMQNQVVARAHRIGQLDTVTVFYLLSKGTIEENIVEMQEKKNQITDIALTGKITNQDTLKFCERVYLLFKIHD